MFRLLKSTFFSLFLFSSVFTTAHAQNSDISLQVSPQFPRPNGTVTVSAKATGTDLDVATFTWNVNGKVFKKGKGITSIQVTAGKAGSATRVSTQITLSDSGYVSREVTFKPADVSLVWKSDGYVPPFYKGKALETYGSEFTVTAIPEFFTSGGNRINPKTLVYTWQKNGTTDADQSGYGKDTYKGVQTSYTRGEDEISVLVTTTADDVGSGQKISLVPGIPEILFYENSPLYGVLYESALQNRFALRSEELTLHASFFDIALGGTNKQKLSIDWSMNGTELGSFRNKSEIVLRKSGDENGETSINLTAQHENRLMQGGQAAITILQ